MGRFLSLAALCYLLFAIVAPAHGDDAIELRWRFKKGDVLKYRFRDHQERTVTVNTDKLETTIDADYEWQWKVQDVDAQGDATLEHRFTSLKHRHTSKDYELEYDSSKANDSIDEEKKKAMQFFDQLRLGTFRVKLTADGRITEVYGLDKLIGETTAGSNVADFHAVHLRDASFAWLLQRAIGSLPAKAVKPDATWKVTPPETLTGFGALSGSTEITLGKTTKVGEAVCRELESKGAQSLDLEMKFGSGSTFKGPIKADKLSAKVLFDPASGSVRKSEADLEVGGDLKLDLNGNAIDVKVSYRHHLELEQKP